MTLPTSDFLQQLARDAGQVALHYYGKTSDSEEIKDDFSVVTEADRAVEKFLHERILRAFPEHSIIGEEGTAIQGKPDAPVWVIDPIDGTANFAYQLPTWCISIGILHENQPKVGVIYCPVSDDMYATTDDGHATWHRDGQPARELPLHDPPIPERATMHLTTSQHKHLRLDWTGRTLCIGAVAIDLALIARGVGQAVVTRPCLWDVAAGFALLLNSGGVIKKLDGSAIDYAAWLENPHDRVDFYLVGASSEEVFQGVKTATTCLYQPE
jgi:fructose-1,6-bisphosphatase/inositol monophosphatase family enzyme